MDDERGTLLGYLSAQRQVVLAILAGVEDEPMRRAVLPSGWTPIGLLAHLCDAERYWFQWVLTGRMSAEPLWPEGPDGPAEPGPFQSDLSSAVVIEFYREQARISDAHLARLELGDPPEGTAMPMHGEIASSVRSIVLHMVEETARHAGHLDVARELIDGTIGLGPR